MYQQPPSQPSLPQQPPSLPSLPSLPPSLPPQLPQQPLSQTQLPPSVPQLPPQLPSLPQQPPSQPSLPPQLPPQLPQQHPESDERETLRRQIEQHQFNTNLISEDTDELLPVVPPIPTPSEISHMRPSDIISKKNTQPATALPTPLTVNENSTNRRYKGSSSSSMDVDSLTLEKQQLRENISEQYLIELYSFDGSFIIE